MQLIVQGKGIEVSDHLHSYVEKKIARLDRYLSAISEVRMELSSERTRSHKDSQVAQLTVRTDRTLLRAEERTGDIFMSIDMVMDKIKRQIDRYKRKRADRVRGQPEEEIVPEEPLAEGEAEPEPASIVRVKKFRMEPMDPNEAIEQMELLGHDFFVFYNVEEGQINVLYRRRDGNYGLLQPELG